MTVETDAARSFRLVLLDFIVLSLAIVGVAYAFFTAQRSRIESEKRAEMAAIADLKTGQIANWRQERLSDASFILRNRDIAGQIRRLVANPSDKKSRAETESWMRAMWGNGQYGCMHVLTPGGRSLLTVPEADTIRPQPFGDRLSAIAAHHAVEFTDLDLDRTGRPYLQLIIPVYASNGPVAPVSGFVTLVVDPFRILYPLVRSWPIPAPGSDAVLVRRDGDSAVVLSDLADGSLRVLATRYPLTAENLPEAMAGRGEEGVMEGVDHRGTAVLASIRHVPQSPWFLVCEGTTAEAYAEIRSAGVYTLVIVLLLIVAAAVTVLLLWTRRQSAYERAQQAGEVTRQLMVERYDVLARYANDAIILFTDSGRIDDVNERAVTLYGYAREEFRHLNAAALRANGDRVSFDAMLRIAREENGRPYEEVHVRRDGVRFPVEVSTRVVDVTGGLFFQSIIRDISDRRQAEDRLEQSERRFRAMFEQSGVGMAEVTPDGKFLLVNERFCRFVGYTRDELRRMDFGAITHPDDLARNRQEIALLVSGEVGSLVTEKRYLRRDGSVVWVRVTVALVRDAAGAPDFIVSVVEDIGQQRDAEEALRASEAKYRSIFESITDVYYRVNIDGAVELVSPSVKALLGYTPAELQGGRAPAFVVHPEEWRGLLDRVARQGAVPDVEITLRRKSGEELIVSVSARGVTDAQGRLVGYDGLLRDITERRRSEEQLRLLTRAVGQAQDVVFMTKPDGTITFCNAAFEQVYGYSRDEVIGRTPRLFSSGRQSQATYEMFWREILAGRNFRGEFVNRTKDGRFVVVQASVTPVVGDGGAVQGFIAVQHDVTEQKRAEDALRESEEKYRRLFEDDLTADSITTPDGRILACNPAFARIYGFSSVEDALTHSVLELYESPAQRGELLAALHAKERLEYHEVRLRRIDGRPVYIIENMVGRFDAQGHLIEVQTYAFDNTERKKLEQQLLQVQKMESIGTLAGGIAHDFNNILAIILGFTGLLSQQRDQSDRFQHSVDSISKAVQRGAHLVRQILTFARKTEVDVGPVSVNELIRDLAHMLEETFPKSIEIRTDLQRYLDPILGDQSQIHQALLNLAVNARDAMPSGGSLMIRTELVSREDLESRFASASVPAYVRISVQDTGHGMDEATRQRIFEPFFTTKDRGKGTGLGLSVVYGVATGHGGFIDVQSSPGHGSTFMLYLPSASAADLPRAEGREASLEIRGGTETVLLAEDEDALRHLATSALEANGYRVIAVVDGVEALEVFAARANEIDLIVSDLGMPRLGGRETVLRARARRSDLPVIIVSGHFDPEEKATLSADGIENFLQKPYHMDDLLRIVRSAIDHH